MNPIARNHLTSARAQTHLFGLALLAMGVISSAALAADATPTPVAEVGRPAPDFSLKDTEGKSYTLSQVLAQGKTVVLEWFNPDCPFIKRHHLQDKDMTRLYDQYKDQGVVWFAVNSGAPGAEGAGLERNIKAKADYQIDYPILLDQSGAVGQTYGAKTTPHMFVIRRDGVLVYSGAIDDDPRGTKTERVNYVQAALGACAAGSSVAMAQTRSYGCSVKYAAIKKS
jgi:peroxiredoxin